MAFGKLTKVDDIKGTVAGKPVEPSPDWDGPTWECASVGGKALTTDALQDRLNEMGARGWEPYAVLSIGNFNQVLVRRRTR